MVEIPKWLKGELDEEDLRKISDCVAHAESEVAAEIVPMVVRRSSATHHVPVILALSLLVITFALGWPEFAKFHLGHYWVWLGITFAAIFAITSWLARLTAVQRHLTSYRDLTAQVHTRAQLEFYQCNIQKTHDATGILIFISMMERQAVVLADRAIAQNVPEMAWKDIVATCTHGIGHHSLAKGLCSAVEHIAEILQTHAMTRPHEHNELANELVMKE